MNIHFVHDQILATGKLVGVSQWEHGKPFRLSVTQKPGDLHSGHKEFIFLERSCVAFKILAMRVGLVCALKSFSTKTLPLFERRVAQSKASLKESISLMPFRHSGWYSSSGRTTNWCVVNCASERSAFNSFQLDTCILALCASPPKKPISSIFLVSSIKITNS